MILAIGEQEPSEVVVDTPALGRHLRGPFLPSKPGSILASAEALDAVDMNAENTVATLDALHDLVANPSPRPRVRSDENRGDTAVL